MSKEDEKLRIIFETVNADYNWIKEHGNDKLLGTNIGMTARDLLIVFFMVEELYGIKISEKEIVDRRFSTYEQIVNLTCRGKE